MKIRSPYNYDQAQASVLAGVEFEDDGHGAIQSAKEECDINVIVKRFGIGGEMPQSLRMPMSGDFTGITDFHTAMNLVVQAQEEFMRLPAEMRVRFNHDPQELVSFLQDEKNVEEARKLGLVNMPPEKTRDVVQAVDELAAALKPAG